MSVLAPYGIFETVVIDPVGGLIPNKTYWSGAPSASTHLIGDYIKTAMPANSVDGLEMPNELDIFYGNYKWHPGDTSALSGNPSDPNFYGAYGEAVTRDSWAAIKSDPALAAVKIIGPTIGAVYPSAYAPESLFSYVDFGGFHPYPSHANPAATTGLYDTIPHYYWNSFQPSVNIGTDAYGGTALMFTLNQPSFSKGSDLKAMVATETGYFTASGAPWGII
ncbi:MAG: hypothetical protein WA324_07540, partial [Bryobacteraceae bacterium]